MTLTFIFLALTAFYLFRNYAQDKGRHTAAKVVHAVVLVLIIVMHTYSVKQAGYLIQHFSEFKASHSAPVGIVPGDLNFITLMLHEILSVIVLFVAFSTARRIKRAVILFRALLVISVPVKVISYYRGFMEASPDLPNWIALGTGVIVITLIYGGIAVLYGTRFMRAFFNSPEGITAPDDSWKELA
ncbi:MAG: hypothetical protein IPM12_09005 [Flavobacteriales bacterium]|nr:hypothetical protein [Flavobacteriales bacterium]